MVCTLFYQEDLIHNTLKLFSQVFSTALHVCTTVSMGHSSSGAILLKVSVLCSHLSCGRGTRYSCLGGRSYHLFVFGGFLFCRRRQHASVLQYAYPVYFNFKGSPDMVRTIIIVYSCIYNL